MPAGPRRATRYVVAALLWSLALFGLLRAPWVERAFVVPLAELQQHAAAYYAGSPRAPTVVTLECSGTDVVALCLAAILACPVPLRARGAGAALGVALLVSLNTVRIATLGLAAASPALFRALHLYVWPVLLVVATAGYVFAWMRWALGSGAAAETGPDDDRALLPLLRRFAPRAAVLLAAFALCAPALAESPLLLAACARIAEGAAFLLGAVGVPATATGRVLATRRGAFLVTPECLATALVPLYAAAVLTARWSWRGRALALLAAAPLFAALAIARLLLLALPPVVAASPEFLVHGFHQLVLGGLVVVLLARWREPRGAGWERRAAVHAATALAVAILATLVASAGLTSALLVAARAVAVWAPHTLTALSGAGDSQGALALLPAYQAGLLLALGIVAVVGWRRFVLGFGVLLVSQLVLLMGLGELDHAGLAAHALALRAWAVGVPMLLTLAILVPLRPVPARLA